MSIFSKLFGRKQTPTPVNPEGGASAPENNATPDWRYNQAYGEGAKQAGYVAEQGLKTESQAPTATPVATPEGAADTRPEWIRKEEPRLKEGYAQEGIAQVPQVPQSSQTPPPTGENKG